MSSVSQPTILLDDGEYFIALGAGREQAVAAGFLEHRCARSDAAPRGAECVGAFFGGPEGTWSARIASAADGHPEVEYDTIVAGAKRLDAIVALWLARHDARLAQQAT
jgi:hypothetical protein